MTREEREAFVRRAWFGEGTAAEAVTKIVDRWEDEIGQYFDEGRYAEQESRGAEG